MFSPPASTGLIDGTLLEQPDALLEEEILVEQRPDRAEVDDVAGEFVVERLAGEDVDLFLVPAAIDEQLARAR